MILLLFLLTATVGVGYVATQPAETQKNEPQTPAYEAPSRQEGAFQPTPPDETQPPPDRTQPPPVPAQPTPDRVADRPTPVEPDPVPTQPVPNPPRSQPLLCSILGWNDSVYNAQTHIPQGAGDQSSAQYAGFSHDGVILNRQAVSGSSYTANGAASVQIDCDRAVTASVVAHEADPNEANPVDMTGSGDRSIQLRPAENGPAEYSTTLQLVARDDGALARLRVFVHNGDRYSHFAIATRFDVSQSTDARDVVSPSGDQAQSAERFDSYRFAVPADGAQTRHVLCAALPAAYAGPAPGYGSPPQGYESPPQGYESPPQGYESPPQGYESPPQGYESPPQGYESPPQGYESPPQGYESPPQGYESPTFAGGAPAACYIVQSELHDAVDPANIMPETGIKGFVAILPQKTGEVLERHAVFPSGVSISENSYTYGDQSQEHVAGLVQVTGMSDGCIEFTTSYLAYTGPDAGPYMVRWCRDSGGEGFVIDSVTAVTDAGADLPPPVVRVAVIRQVLTWSSSGSDDVPGSTSLPLVYDLYAFIDVHSQLSMQMVENNQHLRGLVISCISGDAPSIDKPDVFVISKGESIRPPEGFESPLSDFYWLFFTGDEHDSAQNTATLQCGSQSIPVVVHR